MDRTTLATYDPAMDTPQSPDDLLTQAQAGSATHLGQLLELYRHYLQLLARIEIGRRLQAKVDASDLVQETMLEAYRNFARFRGTHEAQFTSWLRQILAASLCNLVRRYLGTQGRDVRLEQDLRAQLDRSSQMLANGFVDGRSSPSQQAARREQSVVLAESLAGLPTDYREVLVLRHLEGLSFPEISQRMGRSLDSVEKLWVRGLARLRQSLGAAS